MLMTDAQIAEAVQAGKLRISDFEKYKKESLQPASYDLHLGAQAVSSKRREIVDIAREGVFILEPGEFGVVLTHERLELPSNIAGHFGLRSYFSRRGVTIFGGIQVDPGFHGRLKIGLYNLSPKDVAITYLETCCTLELFRLSEPVAKPYDGPYQDEDTITAKDLAPILEARGMTFGEVLRTLGDLSQQMHDTNLAIRSLGDQFKQAMWVYGIGLAVIAILIAIK